MIDNIHPFERAGQHAGRADIGAYKGDSAIIRDITVIGISAMDLLGQHIDQHDLVATLRQELPGQRTPDKAKAASNQNTHVKYL